MGTAYGVGLILIYLLVVAQFKSYVTPLIIMAPIPLTIIGVMPGMPSSAPTSPPPA
jgi:multidrug efflux pump subunit AcrB